ncbi:MAG: hypothetical protein OEY01_12280 [Desulfobulbaceae bacterium]|nr:hypothetical protein [Desulfobulbaceae bacterium]
MIRYLNVIKLLTYIYPIRKFYHQRICSRFYNYHVLEIIKKVNSEYKICSYFDLIYVFKQPPFRGLINTLFQPNNFYLSPKDIAIAINISISGFCNPKHTNNEKIIDFSFHLASEIKERVKLDTLLNSELDKIKKDINLLVENFERNEIIKILSNKKKMFEEYFKTFADERFNDEITIWHQNQENSFIEWQKEDSITVKINFNKIREGFFLKGFDYSSKKHGSLWVATNIKGYEYFNGKQDKAEIVWLK